MTTEGNVHFDKMHVSVEQLEGEDWDFVKPPSDTLTVEITQPSICCCHSAITCLIPLCAFLVYVSSLPYTSSI